MFMEDFIRVVCQDEGAFKPKGHTHIITSFIFGSYLLSFLFEHCLQQHTEFCKVCKNKLFDKYY